MTYAATDKSSDRMPPFVQSGQSVTIELHVDDVLAAYDWFRRLGFSAAAVNKGFAVVTWNGWDVLIGRRPAGKSRPEGIVGELRLMHDDVDELWSQLDLESLTVIREAVHCRIRLRESRLGFPGRAGSTVRQHRHA